MHPVPATYHLTQRYTQGTYSLHYSLIFTVYNILFTICALLKLYTIGHVAGSGKKYKGYRFKTSQLSTKKTWSNGQLYPGLKTTSSQAGRCARHDTSNQVKIREGKFCSVAPNEWLVLYINSCSGAGLLEDCQGLPGEDCDGDWGDWCPAQEVGETVAKETQMSELYNDCWSVFVVKCWNIWILCTSNISDYIPKITQGR